MYSDVVGQHREARRGWLPSPASGEAANIRDFNF